MIKPRYEMKAFADLDCEEQVAAEWHDSYTQARTAADETFVMGMTRFACVFDHQRGYFPYRSAR